MFVVESQQDQEYLVGRAKALGWRYKPTISCFTGNPAAPLTHPKGNPSSLARSPSAPAPAPRLTQCALGGCAPAVDLGCSCERCCRGWAGARSAAWACMRRAQTLQTLTPSPSVGRRRCQLSHNAVHELEAPPVAG